MPDPTGRASKVHDGVGMGQAEENSNQRDGGLCWRVWGAVSGAVVTAASFVLWLVVGTALYIVLLLTVGMIWPVWVWITALVWSIWNIIEGSVMGLIRMLMPGGSEGGQTGAEIPGSGEDKSGEDKSLHSGDRASTG